MNSTVPTMLAGIGSPHGDDRAGWLVADAIRQCLADGSRDRSAFAPGPVEVRKLAAPSDLLDHLDPVRRLIICDACLGAGRAGTAFRWLWPDAAIARFGGSGTHDLSVSRALELAAALGRLPPEVVVWGIAAEQAAPLSEISPRLRQSLPAVIDAIRSDLGHA